MRYTIDDIERILKFKSWSKKRKVDQLLEFNALLSSDLGIDTTTRERLATKRKSKQILQAIKTVDPELGTSFLQHWD